MSSAPPTPRILHWLIVWALLGGLLGIVLVLTGDTGHLPPLMAPFLLALAGAFGGLAGGVLFTLLRFLATRGAALSTPAIVAWSALAGALAGGALYFGGVGATLPYCLAGGAAAGVVSALVGLRTRRKP